LFYCCFVNALLLLNQVVGGLYVAAARGKAQQQPAVTIEGTAVTTWSTAQPAASGSCVAVQPVLSKRKKTVLSPLHLRVSSDPATYKPFKC
jgi:hypothetical protein